MKVHVLKQNYPALKAQIWSISRLPVTSGVPMRWWEMREGTSCGKTGSPHELGAVVAVETVGDWYWIVVEIEQVGFQAPPGPRRQGQAHTGEGEQYGQARRSRTEAAPAGRDLT